MNRVLTEIIVVAFSFLFGALLNRWWNRARPLVVLQGFGDVIAGQQTIKCSDELEQLTDDSWHSDRFPPGEVALSNVQFVFWHAEWAQEGYEDAVEKLAKWQEEPDQAPDVETIRAVVKDFATNPVVLNAFELALMRNELQIRSMEETAEQPLLPIVESEEDNGSFKILWKSGEVTTFSSNLNALTHLKPRLQPFVQGMKFLDKQVLLEALRGIAPLIDKQTRIHRKLLELTKPIVEENNRWASKILIVNYGAAPMIIWPSGTLVVRHKPTRAKIRVTCNLALESGEPPTVQSMEGVQVLAPGERVAVWAVTEQVQRDIADGDVLRAHYNKGNADAVVELEITRRGALWERSLRSEYTTFRPGVQLPE